MCFSGEIITLVSDGFLTSFLYILYFHRFIFVCQNLQFQVDNRKLNEDCDRVVYKVYENIDGKWKQTDMYVLQLPFASWNKFQNNSSGIIRFCCKSVILVIWTVHQYICLPESVTGVFLCLCLCLTVYIFLSETFISVIVSVCLCLIVQLTPHNSKRSGPIKKIELRDNSSYTEWIMYILTKQTREIIWVKR